MTPPIFAIALKKDANTWYVSDGVNVTTTGTETFLKAAPEGWEEIELKWGRNLDYRTLMRSFSTTLQFVKDGAAILRQVNYTQGIEGGCQIVIKKRNSQWLYEDYYTGDLDFSTFEDDTIFCSIQVLEAGISALVKAYSSTPVEIPISYLDRVPVYADGIKQRAAYNWLVSAANTTQISGSTTLYVATNHTVDEGGQGAVITQSNSVLSGGDKYILEVLPLQSPVITVSLKQTVNYSNTTIAGTRTKLRFYIQVLGADGSNKSNTIIYEQPDSTASASSASLNINASKLLPVTLVEGDRLVPYYVVIGENGEPNVRYSVNFMEGQLKMENVFRLPASIYYGYRGIQLFKKLADKIQLGTAVKSNLLSNPNGVYNDLRPYHKVYTCGDSIRGLTGLENTLNGSPRIPAIKTSLTEFLKAEFAEKPAGFAIENNALVFERLDYFFDPFTEVLNLGETTDLKVAPATEYYASSLRVGYENQTYDELNGKDEFNTSQTYKLPISRATETADFISPYRADMYGIETYRANLSQKKTTDSSSDNDTFIVSIESNIDTTVGGFRLYRPQNTSTLILEQTKGLLFPDTAFNLDLSPKRNLLRNGLWLKLMTYLQAGKSITYQTTDKNPDVSSNLGTGLVIENSDLLVDSLPKLPFLPVYLRFSAYVDNLNEIMRSYPKGYFSFTYNGELFKGFLDSASAKPGRPDEVEFQLLAHPDLDILTLMNRCAQ